MSPSRGKEVSLHELYANYVLHIAVWRIKFESHHTYTDLAFMGGKISRNNWFILVSMLDDCEGCTEINLKFSSPSMSSQD